MTDEELLAHMRDRVERLRKIIKMAHDPKMIEPLATMADEGEADIKRLEQSRGVTHIIDPPRPH